MYEVRAGDALEQLALIGDNEIHCCVTSPPYFGLRDYGQDGQMGLEATPDEYVARLVAVFAEVKRVLRDDGTLWLNLGDSYAANRTYQVPQSRNPNHDFKDSNATVVPAGMKAKDLMGVPWMVAFALRADGWYLRSEIIWSKPNPMPESVTDRPTKAHEQVFLLSKSPRYFYDADAIREADAETDHARSIRDETSLEPSGGLRNGLAGIRTAEGRNGTGRNKRSVWTIATQPYPEAHFATFPPKLIEPMILAGCPRETCGACGAPWERVVEREAMVVRPSARSEVQGDEINDRRTATSGTMLLPPSSRTTGFASTCEHDDRTGQGIVLDPFAGSGTTLQVAEANGRNSIGIELNSEYAELIHKRLMGVTPSMFDVANAA